MSLVLQTSMDTKAHRNWSITINYEGWDKPEMPELICAVPGWKLSGQYERGTNGTLHFQGHLKTPPVKFTAVKREFPRAHIEIARNAIALDEYCHKDESRVAEFKPSGVPNMFDFQKTISAAWSWKEFSDMVHKRNLEATTVKQVPNTDDLAMEYLDMLVQDRIEKGDIGIEFIAINPMWRSSWKRFYRAIIYRNQKNAQIAAQIAAEGADINNEINEIIIPAEDIQDAPPFSPSSSEAAQELQSNGGSEDESAEDEEGTDPSGE